MFIISFRDEDGRWWVAEASPTAVAVHSSSIRSDAQRFHTRRYAEKIRARCEEITVNQIRSPYRIHEVQK